jgi:hypothetical protein
MVQGEFAAGAALGRSVGIWIKNLPSFLILAVIGYAPALIYAATRDPHSLIEPTMSGRFIDLGLSYVGQSLATAGILYGVIQQLRGQHAGIGESLGVGLKRLLPVIGVGIVVGLATMAGLIALIVPGIIIGCMLYVAVPAAVIEKPGLGGALKRSQELTGGYKVQIFGLFVIIALIQIALGFALQKTMVPDVSTVTDLEAFLQKIKTYLLAAAILNVIVGSLGAVLQGVVYHDLRVAKEGIATEDLAKVFE